MTLPERYKTQEFTKESQLKKMYGDNPTAENLKEFEIYWNSDKRWEDQDAFERVEHEKWIKSDDERRAALAKNRPLKTMKQKFAGDARDMELKFNRFRYASIPAFKAESTAENPVTTRTTNQDNQDWHNHMGSTLGYKKSTLRDGTTAYYDENTGVIYYNNGYARNPVTKNRWRYKWQDLRPVKSYLTGGNKLYDNIQMMQGHFDRLYNEYLHGQYYDKMNSRGSRPVKSSIRQHPGYDQAWKEFQDLYNSDNGWLFNSYTRKNKNGGIINKHQQGGTMNQDIQQQIVQLVQAAMQGNKEATQQINQIMAAAKQGDQKATQLAQMIQAVAQQMQGGSVKAALGAKLNYIQKLKGNCPEGTEKIYLKNGGCMCQQKKQSGGALPNKNNALDKLKKKLKPKTPLKPAKPADPVNIAACGGKAKKKK